MMLLLRSYWYIRQYIMIKFRFCSCFVAIEWGGLCYFVCYFYWSVFDLFFHLWYSFGWPCYVEYMCIVYKSYKTHAVLSPWSPTDYIGSVTWWWWYYSVPASNERRSIRWYIILKFRSYCLLLSVDVIFEQGGLCYSYSFDNNITFILSYIFSFDAIKKWLSFPCPLLLFNIDIVTDTVRSVSFGAVSL